MKKYITGGFIAPTPAIKEGYPDLVVEKSYADMQECGIDVMISISFGEKDFPEHYKKQFEYAEKFGVKLLVIDEGLYMRTPIDENWKQKQESYSKYDSYGGLLLGDEPSMQEFDKLRFLYLEFKKKYPEKLGFINLLPCWANGSLFSGKEDEVISYEKYVNEFVQTVKPDYLSYDLYPFVGEFPFVRNEYFQNLAIIREVAERENIEFYSFMQGTSYGEGIRMPTEAEMLFQVNTSIAYGCTGFFWFTWNVPIGALPVGESYRSAIIDYYGNKTERYESVKKCIKQIRFVETYLSNCKCVGVFKVENETKNIDTTNVFISGKHLVVGEFLGAEDSYLYVVNSSLTESDFISIKSNKEKLYLLGNENSLFDENLKMELTAGCAALIKVIK